DADDQRQLGRDRLEDGIGGKRRRHVNHRRVRARLLDGISDGVEHRRAFELGAAFSRHHTGDHVGAVFLRALGMKGAGLAGDALHQEAGIFVDENAHLASSTIFLAPSAMSLAATRLRPESARIFLPSSTLVPSRRTTSGTFKPTSLTAVTTP